MALFMTRGPTPQSKASARSGLNMAKLRGLPAAEVPAPDSPKHQLPWGMSSLGQAFCFYYQKTFGTSTKTVRSETKVESWALGKGVPDLRSFSFLLTRGAKQKLADEWAGKLRQGQPKTGLTSDTKKCDNVQPVSITENVPWNISACRNLDR